MIAFAYLALYSTTVISYQVPLCGALKVQQSDVSKLRFSTKLSLLVQSLVLWSFAEQKTQGVEETFVTL